MCPFYLDNNHSCSVKLISNPKIFSLLQKKDFKILHEQWNEDCQGRHENCSFIVDKPQVEATKKQSQETPQEKPHEKPVLQFSTKVSIHQHNNPYAVKSDIIYYPTNSILTVDDPLLNKLSRFKVQEACDKISKPYKMGQIYVTSNGDENSLVKSKKIVHAVVAGESRLVNEEDIRSSTKQTLIFAELNGYESIVMIPADCGTHDISDTARVQLSAVKTYLQSSDKKVIKNIYFVMEDEVSYSTYREYYNRIFNS
jgi:O-acetyl-ADP-ribose deacetylase (regulator of RNase III)